MNIPSLIGDSLLTPYHLVYVTYTTNSTERSTSESDLESSVESHRALVEHSTDLLSHCSASAWWDSTDDSKSLSLTKRSVAAAKRSMGLVVYYSKFYFLFYFILDISHEVS